MSLKPIILYGHSTGPNPWKVQILLDELNIPYEHKLLEFGPDGIKGPEFLAVNPNGRVPGIIDPNQPGVDGKGVKVWESGAIFEYLLEHYDKEKKFQYSGVQERAYEQSWLHFQMSGQGPYFGQFMWFNFFHAEKGITSAIDRYTNEIKRVWGVIDKHLKDNGTPYLVGDKISYADLAWIPWNHLIIGRQLVPGADTEFPTFFAWHERLMARPAVQKMVKDRDAAMAKK